ncbi:hypothetical protein BT96DRAFT_952121 [Gymnopus androsaceus JB14]|uniref:Uncharacterized protein n=1 Tax=Gymnopus androsaceus JB14 TaxID=1447944 RepID=A0A6A4GAN9_9AGAR|nr:hypothetical protein BT96DRAFT_952121 [Gymnopus androsaceus JB14]
MCDGLCSVYIGCRMRVFWYPFDPHQVYQASHKCQSSPIQRIRMSEVAMQAPAGNQLLEAQDIEMGSGEVPMPPAVSETPLAEPTDAQVTEDNQPESNRIGFRIQWSRLARSR